MPTTGPTMNRAPTVCLFVQAILAVTAPAASLLFSAPTLAAEAYDVPISMDRVSDAYTVNADGSYRHTVEATLRILTPQGCQPASKTDQLPAPNFDQGVGLFG